MWVRSAPLNGGTVIPAHEVVATMLGFLMVGGTDANTLYGLACEGFGQPAKHQWARAATTGVVGAPLRRVTRSWPVWFVGVLHAPAESALTLVGE